MMMNGDEGGPPTRIGTSILDYGTGMWTAMGALAGLVQRQHTGRGCVVDASLFETGLAWLKGHFASYRASGEVPERHRTGQQARGAVPGLRDQDRHHHRGRGQRPPLRQARGRGRASGVGEGSALRHQRRAGRQQGRAARRARRDLPHPDQGRVDRCAGSGRRALRPHPHACPRRSTQPQAEALGIIQRLPGDDYDVVSLPLSFDGQRPPIRRAPPRIGEHDAEIK